MGPFSNALMHTQTYKDTHTHMHENTYMTTHMQAHINMHTTYKALTHNYAHFTHSKLCTAHLTLVIISTHISGMHIHYKCI